MEQELMKPTVSPAVPLHWLMFVLSSASNISTTFHHLLQAAGGDDGDHGVVVVDVDVVVDSVVVDVSPRPGSPPW